MKSFKFRLSFLLPILIILNISLNALVLKTDNFTSTTDGWSGGSQNSGKLVINRNSGTSKTYNLGDSYANRTITIYYEVYLPSQWDNGWWWDRDRFYEAADSWNYYYNFTSGGGTYSRSFTYSADSNGDIEVIFWNDADDSDEYAYIDYVRLEGTPIPETPPIMGSVPDQFVIQNDVLSLDISNYVTPTNGDTISYTLGGDTLPIGINFSSLSGVLSGSSSEVGIYNLSVYATDNDGDSSTDNFILEISVPTPPTMDTIPDQTITDDSTFTLSLSDYLSSPGSSAVTNYTLGGDLLPIGLDFNSTTGVLSGSTTDSGTYNLNATASNINGTSTPVSAFTLTVTFEHTGVRNFSMRSQYNVFGDVKVIGNTVLCKLDSDGACVESGNNLANDDVDLQKAPSSSTTLNLPAGSTVEYARIYWAGRQKEDESWTATAKAAAKKIELRKNSNIVYTELIADSIDYNTYSDIPIYSASADAISIVDSNGTYDVNTNSFFTLVGETAEFSSHSDGLGASGGWVLVVVYTDPNEITARNISVFDGYKIVTSNDDAEASITGFVTPESGLVDSKAFVYASEGDLYLSGTSDRIMMGDSTQTDIDDQTELGTFDSRIDTDGIRTPSLANNNGFDIHKYNVGTANGGKNIIGINETGANFTFTSNADVYFPSLFVLSTELYLPKLCYDYSIRQDGQFLNVDRNAYPVARLDSSISASDLDITVYLTNLEADIKAENIAMKADVNDTVFDHVGNISTSYTNGSTLVDRGTPANTDPLCVYNINGDNTIDGNNACTTGHDIRKGLGNLDSDDYAYMNYKLSPKNISGLTSVDEPLGLSIRYSITVNGSTVTYPDYELGSINVPLCTPTSSYTPAWGQFNVVESGQTAGSITNNIYTKISRLPFGADVVFDSNPATGATDAPSTDVDTTVLVEIIDMDSFGDINASCANPSSSLTTPIFVPINFDSSSYQQTLATQDTDYYNFAVKNAAYRVWYFDDENGTLIENWTATTDVSNTSVTAIDGLYNPIRHSSCSTLCDPLSTSVACFNCIKANYARPICSRDNFSVRPESYNMKIYDIDHTTTDALKDTTKFNISNQDGFDPESAQTTARMQLAAGYNYRFDIDATGHDGIIYVPGYTRNFAGGTDYNATMLWDPQSDAVTKGTACNDTSDVDLNFYVANGVMTNEEEFYDNVGEYKINIIDSSWTAVDYLYASHHVSSNAFDINADCNIGSTASTISNSRYGCIVSSNHGNDGGGRYYQDHDVDFHPYKFNMGNNPASFSPNPIQISRGLENNSTFDTNVYMPMADMTFNNFQDQNMSLHISGGIFAQGENNVTVSNFVNDCYAEPLTLTLNKTDSLLSTNHRYVFTNLDNQIVLGTNPRTGVINTAPNTTINLSANDFNKTAVGSIDTILNFNLDRNSSVALNPESVTFITYNADCTTVGNCTMNADLKVNHTTSGYRDLNQTTVGNTNNRIVVNYLYGRTHASRQRYEGTNGTANIYYEAYCFGTIGLNTCNKNLLPQGLNSLRTDDIRWYVNTSHTSNEGSAGTTTQINGGADVTGTTVDGNITATIPNTSDQSTITYVNSANKGYPYKTTMESSASRWLIYNQNDPTATRNQFSVEFDDADSSWSGTDTMETNTKDSNATISNRRSQW